MPVNNSDKKQKKGGGQEIYQRHFVLHNYHDHSQDIPNAEECRREAKTTLAANLNHDVKLLQNP